MPFTLHRMAHLAKVRSAPIAASIALSVAMTAAMVAYERVPAERRPRAIRLLDGLADRMLDLRFTLRGWRPVHEKIVLLLGDETSFRRFGERPWDRATVFAPMITTVCGYGVRVLAFDWIWTDGERILSPRLRAELAPALAAAPSGALEAAMARANGDAILNTALQTCHGRVVLPVSFDEVRDEAAGPVFDRRYGLLADPASHNLVAATVAPGVSLPRQRYDTETELQMGQIAQSGLIDEPELVPPATPMGFTNLNPDGDGLYRRTQLFYRRGSDFFSSFALRAAQIAAGAADAPPVLAIGADGPHAELPTAHGPVELPIDRFGDTLVNYRGPHHFFPAVSMAQLFDASETVEYDVRVPPFNVTHVKTTKAELFRDAIVIFAYSAVGAGDIRPRAFSQASLGFENHANIIDDILTGELLRRPLGNPLSLALYALLALLATTAYGWAIAKLSIRPATLLAVVAVLATLAFNQFVLFERLRIVFFGELLALQLALQYLAISYFKYVAGEAEKRRIRDAFEKYVSPDVINAMLADPRRLKLGGEKRELTVLFSDIRGFTSLAEKLEVGTLTLLLNEYLGAMTEILMKHRGTLDKYIGDAVMGFWGAPLDNADHAVCAVRAAVEMQDRLVELNVRFREHYDVALDIGLGINTGLVSVGNFGSERVFEYTVIGDEVNLASRQEGLCKKYGVGIVASWATASKLPHDEFTLRELDLVAVVGKTVPVRIFEVVPASRAALVPPALLAGYAEGYAHYRARRWGEAVASLDRALAAAPSDVAAQKLRARCHDFEKAPPPADWDGSVELDSK